MYLTFLKHQNTLEKQSVQDFDIAYIINHIRNRPYMGDIERDKIRKLHTSEFFTPFEKVQERLDAYDINVWQDKESQFLDPTCGDGAFLGEVLIRKVENGIDFTTSLESLFGVDLMADNCKLCRERLLCGSTDPKHLEIVQTNIVNADSLRYAYLFLGPGEKLYDDAEAKEQEFEQRLNNLFDFG
jgi:hypothetical protein